MKELFEDTHPITKFSWHKDLNTFTAEDSELGGSLSAWSIVIQNPKTGEERKFVKVKDDIRDGELMGRRFKCGKLNLLIIND